MKTLTNKRRRWSIAGLAVLFSLGIAFTVPSTALAWEDCPYGEVDCAYPGDCARYTDTNDDGICDLSQPEPTDSSTSAGAVLPVDQSTTPTDQSTTPTDEGTTSGGGGRHRGATAALTESADTPTTPPSAAATTGTAANTDSGGNALLTHYYVSPIAIAFFLIYAVSFFLYKTKRIKIATHRKIWNVMLLATFLVTGIFGLLLTIQLDYALPFQMPVDILFWHVEAGIAMSLISIFHIAWHSKYYAKLFRTSRARVRAAESLEGYPARRRGVPGQVSPIPERVHAFERHWEPRS